MIPPKVTRPIAAVHQDWKGGRYPWQLVVAVASWVLVAITLMVSRIGAPASDTDPETSALRDTLGAGAVVAPNTEDHWFLPLLPWLGVLTLLLAVALLLAQGWARLPLVTSGVIGVVALAMAAYWLVFPAMIAFVVGSVFGLLLPTHRYLHRSRGTSADPPTERLMMQ